MENRRDIDNGEGSSWTRPTLRLLSSGNRAAAFASQYSEGENVFSGSNGTRYYFGPNVS